MLCDSLPRQAPSELTVAPSEDLLRFTLPSEVRGKGVWRCRDSPWAERVPEIERLATQHGSLEPTAVLKENAGKRVFLWRDGLEAVPATVVKVSTSLKLRLRFQSRRRLDAEAWNLACADQRGLRVPQLYACGVYGWSFCRRRVVICMQSFPWPKMFDEFATTRAEADQWRLLRRASHSLRRLYETGCVHIDFGPHNILLSPETADEDVVIDLEFAGFLPRPNPDMFAAQAGYFSWCVATNQHWVAPSLVEAWFADLMAEQRFRQPDRLWSIWRRNFLERASTRRRLAWCS
ncbi:MAG TPA: lipopolysaccharide kinase InaA family protein [Planctomycetaceae bacterium]|nr:lipopolysaccharide kinase InaA family protein [Planctomycetaceae bacterium]